MKIRKEDEVLVIAGKDRGKKGKVRRVLPRESRVLVEGINLAKKHQKPRGGARQTGIIDLVVPIQISNLMLLCGKCRQPTRIGYRFLEGGSKVRVCKRCGEVVD